MDENIKSQKFFVTQKIRLNRILIYMVKVRQDRNARTRTLKGTHIQTNTRIMWTA